MQRTVEDYIVSWVDKKKTTHCVYLSDRSEAIKLKEQVRQKGSVARIKKRLITYTDPIKKVKVV